MKALTLHQPWASLIAVGAKRIETRSWSTEYRGRLIVHAAARKPPSEKIGGWGVMRGFVASGEQTWPAMRTPDGRGIEVLPLGAVVASATLVDVVPILSGAPDEDWTTPCLVPDPNDMVLYDALLTNPRDVTAECPFGDFTPGRFAWLLDDVARVEDRCPWCWPDEDGMVQVGPNHRVPLRYVTPAEACPVCVRAGKCDPIPARGYQGLWEWTP